MTQDDEQAYDRSNPMHAVAGVLVRPAPSPRPASRDLEQTLPAWPIVALLGGFPLWWALGMLPFIAILLAGLMAALMMGRRDLRLVPGVLAWLAFVAWTFTSGIMLDSPLRLVGFALREGQWVAAGISLLYLVNAREALPMRRLVNLLLVIWASTVAGGLLGLAFPDVRLTTPVGLLLPGALTSNEYVQDLVFPALAQVQQPWGSDQAFVRPTAPFAYANSWGAALVILTPVALAALALRPRPVVRLLVVLGLMASVVPAVATTNRGMFLAMALSVGYVAVRLASRGHARALFALIVVGTGVLAVLVAMGLGDAVAARQGAGNTTEGRTSLYVETFQRTMSSPILGYGAPRPSYTSEISVGTQGQVWFVMFSFGFVGLALYLSFLWGAAIRTLPAPTTPRLWLHTVLVATSVMAAYYGLDATMQVVVVLVAGVLLRDQYDDARGSPASDA